MPNNKKHKLSKIKATEKAHPYSRKAVQMRRAINRDDKLAKQKTASDVKKTRVADRLSWFKYALADDIVVATNDQVHEIIEMYIARNDEEIQDIRGKLRKGRPKPSRLDLLENLRAKDIQEYNNGIEIPLLTDTKNVTALRAWDGDYNGIPLIKSTVVRSPPNQQTKAGQEAAAQEEDKVVQSISDITGMHVDE